MKSFKRALKLEDTSSPPPHLMLPTQERQESRCSLIFASCTFAWHTGQLTISAEEEEEGATLCSPAEDWKEAVEEEEEVVVVVVAVFCCISGDPVFTDSLCPADSPPNVLWKKSKMVAGLLRSSHDLFLDT